MNALSYRDQLDTPCLVVDLDLLRRNIEEMSTYARSRGLALRPHLKTHKTAEIAALQQQAGAVGFTCAKLGEVEALADTGVLDDVLVAYQIVGAPKIGRLLSLLDRVRLTVAVDSIAVAEPLSQAVATAGRQLDVVIEIDTGLGRAGVAPGEPALRLAREVVQMPGLRLRGLMTHEGHAGRAATREEMEEIARRAGEAMVTTANLLRRSGIPIEVVSVGSTPAAFATTQVEGITEMRPGTYVFYDAAAFRFGRIGPDRVALRVLTTVISRPAPNRAIIDAGSKTLTTDPPPPGRNGFGYLIDYPDATIVRLNEEHGIVEFPPGSPVPAVGDRLEIIPNHVCPVVNLQDELFVVQHGQFLTTWRVVARGKVR
ncbi:alanine racemase [Thermomicrobium sp. 4228-Ro]|uniref:alanine racemase n=1 Tax=Thermomicrobium sp. 4228-Ro TaxID=2993937 RepID=UPI002248A7B2|nr:alanine racemase [Thermomicrobium sp. 4228-Ro]MCX2727547.1 alanine racemase [Thermomicrobium sp. 4228-Ro]